MNEEKRKEGKKEKTHEQTNEENENYSFNFGKETQLLIVVSTKKRFIVRSFVPFFSFFFIRKYCVTY
jgi:hypothetical protein